MSRASQAIGHPSSSVSICIIFNDVRGKNRALFVINANVHNFPTRSHNDLHLPNANLSVFQKAVYFPGVTIFNNLPTDLNQISHNIHKFQNALKRFLLDNSFCSLEEYYNWKCL